jgi:hypothetical protein
MIEFLKSLDSENDYDTLINKLLDFENVKKIKENYDSLNERVLLSCFIVNFLKEGDHELRQSSRKLSNYLVYGDKINVTYEYQTFFELFKNWRDEDIQGLKSEIYSAQTSLSTMIVEEENDDAEKQWNEGIKINMKIMDNTVSLLDKYGKSPPKF